MSNPKKKVIVVGAGIAGISAAMELLKRDYQVDIYELKKIFGGRAYSFVDKTTGEEIDNGQHVLMGAYYNFLDLLKIFKTDDQLNVILPLKVTYINGKREKFYLDTSLMQGKLGFALGIIKLKSINIVSRIKALYFASKVLLGNIDTFQKTSYQILKENYQSEEAIKNLWEPIILATLNANSKIASAKLFLNVLQKAFLAAANASSLIIPKVGLSKLLSPFSDWIENNSGSLNFNKAIKNIKISNNKIMHISTSDGEVLEADDYIFALPPDVLVKLLPDDISQLPYFENFEEFRFSTIISIYLWFDKDFIQEQFVAGLGTNIQWIFNRRLLVDCAETQIIKYPGHYAITISSADNMQENSNDEILDICLNELDHLFAGFKDSELKHSVVIRNRKATFLATPEIESKRPRSTTPIENMYIVGDWTNTALPATIEGAVISGINAVEII